MDLKIDLMNRFDKWITRNEESVLEATLTVLFDDGVEVTYHKCPVVKEKQEEGDG